MSMIGTLDDFCDELMTGEQPIERLEPERLAPDFTTFFGLVGGPGLAELCLLFEWAGIGKVTPAKLPPDLRGIHYTLPGGGYASTTRGASGRVPASSRCSTRATRSATRPCGPAATASPRVSRCALRRTGSRRQH